MKVQNINKIGAISLISGSILLSIYSIMLVTLFPMHKANEDFTIIIQNQFWTVTTTVSLISLILLLFSFSVVYASIHKEAGTLGFISILVIEAAYFFQAAKVTWEIFIFPVLVANPGSLFLIQKQVLWTSPGITLFTTIATGFILIGTILFCITIIRSKTYSTLSGVLFLLGAVLYGGGSAINIYVAILGITIFSIACLLIGIKLYNKATD